MSNFPSNTVPFINGKFIDISYTESLHMLEFLHHLSVDSNSKEIYKRLLPKKETIKLGDMNVNLRHPMYRYFPFPISIDFAKEYCKWRGEVVTFAKNTGDFSSKISYSEILKYNQTANYKIIYSIPSSQELIIGKKYKFKKYNRKMLVFDVLTTSSNDTSKLYFLRSIATSTFPFKK